MWLRISALGMLIVLTAAPWVAEASRASTWKFKTDYVVDTTGIGLMHDPVWSIDGRFLAARGTQKDLFVYDPSSHRTSKCVSGPIARNYFWLPGGKLVYKRVKPHGYPEWLAEQRWLARPPDPPQHPSRFDLLDWVKRRFHLKKSGAGKPDKHLTHIIFDVPDTYTVEIHVFDVQSMTDKALLIFPFGLETDMQATGDGRVAFVGKRQMGFWPSPPSEWNGGVVDTNGAWTPMEQASTPPLTWEEYGVPYIRKNGITRRVVVDGPGRLWGTKGSHHGSYLTIVTKADYDKQTVIATDQGKWVKLLPYGFTASQWSHDDRFLLGVAAKQDDYGNPLVGSKLAMFDLASKMYSVVEMTPDRAPLNPVWNETTGEVAFHDLETKSVVVGTLSETKK